MIRVISGALARELVQETLLAEGFARTWDPPLTASTRITQWTRGESVIAFRTHESSGLAIFLLEGPEEDALLALVERHFSTRSAREVVAEIAAATSPAKRAAGALILSGLGQHLRFDPTLTRAMIAEPLTAMMRGADPIVATAALDAALDLVWPELDAAVEELASEREDLDWVAPTWREARAENERAAEKRAESEKKQKRLDDLPCLVDERRWDEALSLAEAVFAEMKEKTPAAAWRARTLALLGMDRSWEGAIFATGWLARRGGEEAERTLDSVAPRLPDDESDIVRTIELVVALQGDDRSKLAEAIAALASRKPARDAELAFVAATLWVVDALLGSENRPALLAAERAAAAFPDHPASAYLLGRALAAHDDTDRAVHELKRAIHLVKRKAPESPRLAALSRFERSANDGAQAPLGVGDISLSLASAMWSPERFDTYARCVDDLVADPDVGAEARANLLSRRAQLATRAKKHDDAVTFYRQAIEAEAPAGRKPYDLLRFNLACELAKTGHDREAITALREAIALHPSYARDATKDDYFEGIWHSRDFLMTVATWPEPPTPEAVEERMTRSLGRSYRGEGDEAVEEAHLAAGGAEALGDPALVARALERLGSALTLHGAPARAVRVLERAVALAEQALSHDRARSASIRHTLATALHGAGRLDEAEATYRAALEERVAASGEEAESVATSHGDLARLLLDRERYEDAEAAMARATEILDKSVARTEGEDRWDALVNLAAIQGNRVSAAVSRGLPLSRVVELAESTVHRLDAILQAGARLPGGIAENLLRALSRAAPAGAPPELAPRLDALVACLEALIEPDPVVRAERTYWAALRRGAVELRNAGATDEEIAQAIGRAVRGQDPGPPIAGHPAFRNLSVELANRLTATTDVVMVAMALDLVASGHEPIEKAIQDLEVFAVANATGAREDDDDEIDDEVDEIDDEIDDEVDENENEDEDDEDDEDG